MKKTREKEKERLLLLATRAKINLTGLACLTSPSLQKIIERKRNLALVAVTLCRLLPPDVSRHLMGFVMLDEGKADREHRARAYAYQRLKACRDVDQVFSETSVHQHLREAARQRVLEMDTQLAL